MFDWIGDLLGYKRCSGCGKTMWRHEHRGWVLYLPHGSMEEYCNRCLAPVKPGRLYREDLDTRRLIPINKAAYVLEVKRAGQMGALYERAEDVPRVEHE